MKFEQLINGELLLPPIMTGPGSEILHLVVWFRKRKIEAINNVLINDIVTSNTDKVTIHKHLGQEDQLADSLMVSEIEWWTTKHRLRGIPYLYVRLEWDEKLFSAGLPRIAAWIQ